MNMTNVRCQVSRLDLGSKSVVVRLRVAAMWSKWLMVQKDELFGVRTTVSFEGRGGEALGIREDVCTVDLVVKRLGLEGYRGALRRSGVGLECRFGSAKAAVLSELLAIVEEELGA